MPLLDLPNEIFARIVLLLDHNETTALCEIPLVRKRLEELFYVVGDDARSKLYTKFSNDRYGQLSNFNGLANDSLGVLFEINDFWKNNKKVGDFYEKVNHSITILNAKGFVASKVRTNSHFFSDRIHPAATHLNLREEEEYDSDLESLLSSLMQPDDKIHNAQLAEGTCLIEKMMTSPKSLTQSISFLNVSIATFSGIVIDPTVLKLPNVQDLTISKCTFTNRAPLQIGQNLKQLTLHYCDGPYLQSFDFETQPAESFIFAADNISDLNGLKFGKLKTFRFQPHFSPHIRGNCLANVTFSEALQIDLISTVNIDNLIAPQLKNFSSSSFGAGISFHNINTPQLQSLELSCNSISALKNFNCTSLATLHLDITGSDLNKKSFDDTTLRMFHKVKNLILANEFSQLEELDFFNCESLEILSLGHSFGEDDWFRSLQQKKFSCLKSFAVTLESSELSVIPKIEAPVLEELSVANVFSTKNVQYSIENIYPTVRFLHIQNLFNSYVEKFNLKHIEKLVITPSDSITFQDCSFPSLRGLQVGDASEAAFAFIDSFDIDCPNLLSLNLSFTGAAKLDFSKFEKLVQLKICDSSIESLDMSGLDQLKFLDFSDSEIYDTRIPVDHKNLKHLKGCNDSGNVEGEVKLYAVSTPQSNTTIDCLPGLEQYSEMAPLTRQILKSRSF